MAHMASRTASRGRPVAMRNADLYNNDFGSADEIDFALDDAEMLELLQDGLEFMDSSCSLSSLLFCANRRVLGNAYLQ